jgi:hypothetical protein
MCQTRGDINADTRWVRAVTTGALTTTTAISTTLSTSYQQHQHQSALAIATEA